MSQAGTVYGQGLYTLAQEEGLEEQILGELAVLQTAFGENPEFLKLLASHNIPLQERLDLLEESFRGKVHQYVLNFLKLLTEKNHIRQFPECCKAYREQYNTDKGILEVQVFTAIALSDAQKVRLTDKLTALTGKKISLLCKIDPAVLGGVRLRYDGCQVDGTIQGRLDEMSKTLKNEVNYGT
ncbi:MAG: ATP synthase F1 subunit delta [Oscillospiraceae bacterium]|nr:ATP synthase F1 subunit delta [Oscillospiraceae bacterium]